MVVVVLLVVAATAPDAVLGPTPPLFEVLLLQKDKRQWSFNQCVRSRAVFSFSARSFFTIRRRTSCEATQGQISESQSSSSLKFRILSCPVLEGSALGC